MLAWSRWDRQLEGRMGERPKSQTSSSTACTQKMQLPGLRKPLVASQLSRLQCLTQPAGDNDEVDWVVYQGAQHD